MPNLSLLVCLEVILVRVVVVLVVVVVVTGGKQSQLLVRLIWTGMYLDWSLTTEGKRQRGKLSKELILNVKF